MCKFCNNKAKPIILNVEQDGIMNEKIQVFQATIKGDELMFEIVTRDENGTQIEMTRYADELNKE